MSQFTVQKVRSLIPTGPFSAPAPVVSLYVVEKSGRQQRFHCGTFSPRDSDVRAAHLPIAMKSADALQTIRPQWADAE